jgi:UPF0755 protein
MKKSPCIFFAILCVFLLVGAAGVVFCVYNHASISGDSGVEVNLTIPLGATTRDVAHLLHEKKLVRSPDFVYYFIRLKKSAVKAGIYTLRPGMNMSEIITELESGKQEHISVSIPEGYTIRKTAALLDSKRICKAQDFEAAAHDRALLDSLGLPFASAEGFLFPDTYFLYTQMKPEAIISSMVENFQKRIGDLPEFAGMTWGAEGAAGSALYNTVVLASVVEREYRRAEEAPLIASVFSNRLRYNIGLYSCATIEYIIAEIQGLPHPDVITYDDLAIESPYNTYKHAGLPPSPIANPSIVALRAAAGPPKTPYYFFRLVDTATGTHYFSTDLDEHIGVGTALYTKQAAGS